MVRGGCAQAVGLVVKLAREGAMVPAILSLPAKGTGVRGFGVGEVEKVGIVVGVVAE